MQAKVDDRFDEMLMSFAGQSGGLAPMLKTLFSFLHRKTDFYIVHSEEDAKMGFPAGVAEKLVILVAACRLCAAASGWSSGCGGHRCSQRADSISRGFC